MEDLGCPRQRIHETLSRVISLRGYLLPVIHDVMLRIRLTIILPQRTESYHSKLCPTRMPGYRNGRTLFFYMPVIGTNVEGIMEPMVEVLLRRPKLEIVTLPKIARPSQELEK
ncbi:hypothetical protein PHMEG_0003090 [Phytophthora megakarya]|uniref:Uncharacterized protein n=1 Tax=Phytophthora megakarya TaxID=4795 RepID=A0A225WX65_9STRA|nr:hypothetical protein PHMEG_0003090 [Phytophthora megakarya]